MKENFNYLTLGYDLEMWQDYGIMEPITIEISPQINSHLLLAGISGSGKSFCENILFAKLAIANPKGEFYFGDYKQDDSFTCLRGCPRYFPYKRTLEALNIVYQKMQSRQAGIDSSRHPITFIIDEYVALILALQNEDKKQATLVMNRVSEILMLGRSLNVRLWTSSQRPDAAAFPSGSRLNYGIIMILGAPMRSIYEMLLPSDYIEGIEKREFGVGEGVLLLQGSKLRYIKVPAVRDMNRVQEVCAKALS